MELNRVDCARVDEAEYEHRYIHGALSEAEAEAFEAHYFECERCWASLQRALEVQAALAAPAGHAPLDTVRGTIAIGATKQRRWERRWWPAFAAAAALVVAVGTWQMYRRPAAGRLRLEAERGGAIELRVRPIATPDTLAAAWSPVTGADRYRAQLFAADGTRLADRDLSDTSVSVPRQTLGRASLADGAYWSVEAFDATRHSLAKSRLTTVLPAPSS
jgi:hypothetical protein